LADSKNTFYYDADIQKTDPMSHPHTIPDTHFSCKFKKVFAKNRAAFYLLQETCTVIIVQQGTFDVSYLCKPTCTCFLSFCQRYKLQDTVKSTVIRVSTTSILY